MINKNILASLFFAALLILGCKKNVSTETSYNEEIPGLEKAKANVKAQMDALGGIPARVEVHQRMQTAYADMDGNIINSLPYNNNLVSTCAGDLPDYLDLDYYSRLYQCGVSYKVKFGWMISWNNNVVLQNPNNAANRTRGTIRVTTPTNANAYVNNTTDVVITNVGPDPNNPSNDVFWVEMTSSTLLPVEIVNTPGAILRLGAFFASDCSSLDNYAVVPMSVTGFGSASPLNSNPCTRNDKAIFIAPGALGARKIGISGYDPLSLCPAYQAGAAPSYQYVQYSLNNGLVWNDFQNTTAINAGRTALNNQPFVSRTDFATSPDLLPGTYNIWIRYANIKFSSASTSQNTVPIASNACITGGIWPPSPTQQLPSFTVENIGTVTIN